MEDRALRILSDLGGVSREQGRALLEASAGSVKLALVMARRSLDAAQAAEVLQRSGGNLRQALLT